MEKTELQRLKFRRQYLLSPRFFECPFLHNTTKINDIYTLYTHIDLLVTEYVKDEIKIILLGDIFDYKSIYKKNAEILADLWDVDFEKLLEKSSGYTGRFVIIYVNKTRLLLAHDATATRKIYYSKTRDGLWCASLPYLLAKVLNLKETTNPSKLAYYNSDDFRRLNNANVSDTTRYDEISQVLPNHYMSVNDSKIIRYWPNKRIERLTLGDAADKCAIIIKGFMESVAARYNVMLPVTSGNDSRLLTAATREIRNNVFYYINKERRLNDESYDICIPKKLFQQLGLEFHIIDPYVPVDKDFEKIYYENNPYGSKYFLPHINNYFLNFQDKVNLPGNMAAAPYWADPCPYYLDQGEKKHFTARELVYLYNLQHYEYAWIKYNDWLSNCYDLCLQNNVRIVNLFYWEERLGNWGTQIQLDKDIAQEDINVYNSRLLISLFLSVKLKYNNDPDMLLHKEIIKKLWPELLRIPINPTLKKRIHKSLKNIGVLDQLVKCKSYINYQIFCRKKPSFKTFNTIDPSDRASVYA